MEMGKKMSNQEIAQLLKGMAAAYQIKDDQQFRIRAYEEAAVSVEHATSSLKDLWDDGKLETLSGVGKSIASYLDELFRTGRVQHFKEIMGEFPPAMFEFLKIPGVGAKTAYKLAKELKITSAKGALNRLKKAAQEGEIRRIEGFAEESEKDILEGLDEIGKKGKEGERMNLPFAGALAKEIINYMKQCPYIKRIDPLGSMRRQVATVGDLDFGVVTNKPGEVIKHFCRYPKVKEVAAAGGNTARVITRDNRQIDLKTMSSDAYGALLQHYTGSKQHNIHLREIAQKKGLSLSEYGIKKGKKSVKKYAKEEDFYQALGMKWIPPELREDTGEIEAAQEGKLPHLVELRDIKGDLHTHSNFPFEESHDPGIQSMEEMISRARELGWQYLGFSEHNPSISQHNKSKIIDLIKRKKEKIEQLKSSNKKIVRSIHLLNSVEIDIRPNGELALPDKAIDLLDYAIASIHSSFRMNRAQMTKRALKGLSHPKVRILGHPTGRLLNRREGYELDWERIFDFCKKHDKWLEINAFPNRLDLPDVLVREAVKNGVKMIINTDSHCVEHMNLMEYGVAVARRGWAEKEDIVNTLSYDRIKEKLEGGEK